MIASANVTADTFTITDDEGITLSLVALDEGLQIGIHRFTREQAATLVAFLSVYVSEGSFQIPEV